jgi:dTDP-4-dehydrorhamnose reductase
MAGSMISERAAARGWDCIALTRSQLDITDATQVEGAIATARPEVVINAAAYTAVDAAETNVAEAMSVNGAGAGNVAKSAAKHDASLIHISTDYVFDGSADKPYLPDDPVAPINTYGESKLAGEIAVRDEAARSTVVRTSWIYSHDGRNFVRTMLRLADEKPELSVVNDQYGSPTSAHDLADALISVAGAMYADAGMAGTFHFSNSGIATWYEFACAIFDVRGGAAPRIVPVASKDYPTPAKRPRWSVLDTASFTDTFGITPRPWKVALSETMRRIA